MLRNTEATQRATVLEAKSSSPSQPVNLDGYDRSPAPLQLCQTGVFSASSSNTPFSTTNVNYPVQPRLVRFAENSHFSMESAATSLGKRFRVTFFVKLYHTIITVLFMQKILLMM